MFPTRRQGRRQPARHESEPEVGLEPTTYRLQDSHSTLTVASTSNNINQARPSDSCWPPAYTAFRAIFGATTRAGAVQVVPAVGSRVVTTGSDWLSSSWHASPPDGQE
jgi:hypothetical protein